MKKMVSIYLVALLMSVVGCDSNEPDLPGSFSLLLNGELRSDSSLDAHSDLSYNPSYGYRIRAGWTSEYLGVSQGIYFLLPEISRGSYSILPYDKDGFTYFSNFVESGEDETLQRYSPVSNLDSLTITDFDPSTGHINAVFSGTYVATTPNAIGQTLPDTLRITQGVLTATLSNPPDSP